MKKIAISIGDLNGVGLEIAIKTHKIIKQLCNPIYIVDRKIALKASSLLNTTLDEDFNCFNLGFNLEIEPSKLTSKSGAYSYESFKKAVELAVDKSVDGIVTMPINKEAWSMAGINYKGHTDMLRDIFKSDAIMVLGKEHFFVALYTEHIPYRLVYKKIVKGSIVDFLMNLYNQLDVKKKQIAVLGLNPHAGDGGVLGNEDKEISQAVESVNKIIGKDVFEGAIVPDTAFTPYSRKKYNMFVAMYHDQGLAPLKALYFKESINISLGLPIVRTSVDHGTAFDIAYSDISPSDTSYINAVKEAINLANNNNKIICNHSAP